MQCLCMDLGKADRANMLNKVSHLSQEPLLLQILCNFQLLSRLVAHFSIHDYSNHKISIFILIVFYSIIRLK